MFPSKSTVIVASAPPRSFSFSSMAKHPRNPTRQALRSTILRPLRPPPPSTSIRSTNASAPRSPIRHPLSRRVRSLAFVDAASNIADEPYGPILFPTRYTSSICSLIASTLDRAYAPWERIPFLPDPPPPIPPPPPPSERPVDPKSLPSRPAIVKSNRRT